MSIPTITALTPNVGPSGGRALVRITGTGFQLPPAPPPLSSRGPSVAPNPSVEVLFGTRKAREVRVLSDGLLHVVTPIHDPGAVAVTVRNIDQSGVVVPGETVTAAGAYTFGRPKINRKPSEELTIQRVVRGLVLDLRRQILENTVQTTHTDFDDTPDGANIAALAAMPGLVVSGPALKENREYSLNQPRKTDQTSGSSVLLYPPRTVDLEFTLIGVDELEQELLALMHECVRYFTRNIVFAIPKDVAAPDGPQIEYDMDIVDQFKTTGSPGNSNIRAFSGTFRIQGVDLDDDDMAAIEAFPISDLTRGGGVLGDPVNPALLYGATGPGGITLAPPLQSGPTNPSPGLLDGIQQLPLPEEE